MDVGILPNHEKPSLFVPSHSSDVRRSCFIADCSHGKVFSLTVSSLFAKGFL
ncbi:hypothetical protein ACLOJK_016179 [Asimina triloba]